MNKRLSTVALVALAIESCALVAIGLTSLPNWPARTSNIGPGNTDYPVENPHPRHVIEAAILLPPTIHVQIAAVYTAQFGRGTSPTPRRCHFATKQGTETEYSISLNEYYVYVPIKPIFQADEPLERAVSEGEKRYRASIVVDRFELGRCEWQLDRLAYREDDDSEFRPMARFHPSTRKDENNSAGVYCTTRAATRETPSTELCSGPRSDFVVSAATIGQNSRADWQPYFALGSQRVELRFIDIDHPMNHMIFP